MYFGFGSIRAPEQLARAMIESARTLGRRAIVSRGWAELGLVDDGRDCLAIDEVNHQRLFPRVAAVVHHGGAGTTMTAARAGVPQVVLPQHYDQHYWARRVRELGIGVDHAEVPATAATLASALERAKSAEIAAGARACAGAVRGDGARVAAERIGLLR